MKRSEAIELFINLFKCAPRNPDEMNAENLLGWLDQLGFQPPAVLMEVPVSEICEINSDAGLIRFKTARQFATVNQWEPEDDPA